MTSKRDSEILVHTGPGTPMGELMRQYWIPACLSSELAADGAPLRLMLLGERMIAFRDSQGRVGVMDHRCPHRCASLFLGRNEQGGIRCVYHGWKFDVTGQCVDMPNVLPHEDFKHKVKARAFPVVERAGLVWAYLGARAVPPPLPEFEAARLPADQLRVFCVQRECNWLQALEGDIDNSHFGFLHGGLVKPEDYAPDNRGRYMATHRAPTYGITDTPWGTMYGAHRPAEPGQRHYRFAHFLFPFWTMPPDGPFVDHIVIRAWVPMDDTHTMMVQMVWKGTSPPFSRTAKDGTPLPGTQPNDAFLPNTSDWFGRWRRASNPSNDYLIDREVQSRSSYTGIQGVDNQDQAVTESMGPIVDHAFEHLGPSDRMITTTRRRLIRAAKAWKSDGAVPPCLDDPQAALGARSGDFAAPDTVDWREAYDREMAAGIFPTVAARAAE
ncbi:Rieske 2Fe-2S domain-containing protein [Desertibaculum subflavum]|uniref:Rieske 2Fe-2S domain-containing protein n=1 Tax=Desertibaculum subflavum TaxID=2268458 RepID=UPI000E674596